jgi:protein-disulfide isomerase
MDKMAAWCKENKISYTPTIFFNGHELPKEYDLEDLPYFLRE